MFMMVFMN